MSSESQDKLDAEKELVQTKEDAIIRHTTFCAFDSNERLGNLIKFYGPPGQSYEPAGYGAGAHTNVVSDTGDYTLRYTITVTPPPTAGVKKQFDSNTSLNQMQPNNTFTFFNNRRLKQ